MNVILALNHKEIEGYIGSLENVNVIGVVNLGSNIVKKVEELKSKEPELLIISHLIPDFDDKVEIIKRLSKVKGLRIAYIYGKENSDRKDFIDFLIKFGIYDYHVGALSTESLDIMLFNPNEREDVKKDMLERENKFLKQEETDQNQEHVKTEVKQEIIVKDRLIGNIAFSVFSAKRHIGSTHISIYLANYFKRKGFEVAYIELNENNHIEMLYCDDEDETGDGLIVIDDVITKAFELDGVHYYPFEVAKDNLYDIMSKYQYIILDIGSINQDDERMNEIMRSNLKIFITGSMEWDLQETEKLISQNDLIEKNIDSICMAFNFTDKGNYKRVMKNYDSGFLYGYSPNPFKKNDEIEKSFDQLFSKYIPKTKQKKPLKELLKSLKSMKK